MERATPPENPAFTRENLLRFCETLYPASDPLVMELIGKLRTVSHAVYQRMESSLGDAEVSFAQYRILMGLLFRETIEGEAGLNPSEIAARQGTNRNTISALLRSLESAELVTRELDPNDRRKFNICLTDAGRERVRAHAGNHFNEIDQIFGVLDEQEKAEFGRLLDKLA